MTTFLMDRKFRRTQFEYEPRSAGDMTGRMGETREHGPDE